MTDSSRQAAAELAGCRSSQYERRAAYATAALTSVLDPDPPFSLKQLKRPLPGV